jgi:hypothetical protein
VNVVLKGGTNQVHGSLYEYNQVSRLTAANFFNNRSGQAKANALLNQFGATVGGPVAIPKVFNGRNKLFFYGAWERMDNNRANPTFATVPTAAMRNGDLSTLLSVPGANAGQYQIYNPFTAVAEGTRIRGRRFRGTCFPQSAQPDRPELLQVVLEGSEYRGPGRWRAELFCRRERRENRLQQRNWTRGLEYQ